jgi:hypothetical protein
MTGGQLEQTLGAPPDLPTPTNRWFSLVEVITMGRESERM